MFKLLHRRKKACQCGLDYTNGEKPHKKENSESWQKFEKGGFALSAKEIKFQMRTESRFTDLTAGVKI